MCEPPWKSDAKLMSFECNRSGDCAGLSAGHLIEYFTVWGVELAACHHTFWRQSQDV